MDVRIFFIAEGVECQECICDSLADALYDYGLDYDLRWHGNEAFILDADMDSLMLIKDWANENLGG